MANLVQSDYDGLTGIGQQIAGKVRIGGANAGKRIAEAEISRGACGKTLLAGVWTPDATIRLIYVDGTSEVLTFDGNTDFYPPGRRTTIPQNADNLNPNPHQSQQNG